MFQIYGEVREHNSVTIKDNFLPNLKVMVICSTPRLMRSRSEQFVWTLNMIGLYQEFGFVTDMSTNIK